MRKGVFVFLFCFLILTVRADWSDLRVGLDGSGVLAALGAPLIVTKSRSGRQMTWTYDWGAYVIFENGGVAYWHPPEPRPRP